MQEAPQQPRREPAGKFTQPPETFNTASNHQYTKTARYTSVVTYRQTLITLMHTCTSTHIHNHEKKKAKVNTQDDS